MANTNSAVVYERFNLLIDSSKRTISTETNTNFSVNLTNNYQVKMARLKNASIPLTYYNITPANNTLTYNVFSTVGGNFVFVYTVTVPVGRYSIQNLVQQINTGFSSQNQTYGTLSLSFNANNGIFTFTASNYQPIPNNNGIHLQTSQLLIDLGFANPTPPATALYVDPTLSSTLPCKFIKTEYLKLSLNFLGSSLLNIDNNQTNTTFFLEIDSDYQNDYYGKNLMIVNTSDDTGCKNNVYTTPINLQNFKVTLTHANDAIVDLNNVDWYCIIELIVAVPFDNYVAESVPYIAPNNQNDPSYLNKIVNSGKPDPTKTATPSTTGNTGNIPYWLRF
jgi:hypothetical protein